MAWIEVTHTWLSEAEYKWKEGPALSVNTDHIKQFHAAKNNKTEIIMPDDRLLVAESYDEVKRLIAAAGG